jgi:hypothetical protein
VVIDICHWHGEDDHISHEDETDTKVLGYLVCERERAFKYAFYKSRMEIKNELQGGKKKLGINFIIKAVKNKREIVIVGKRKSKRKMHEIV